jgi:hypothetical protein
MQLRGRWRRASPTLRWAAIALAILLAIVRRLLPLGMERYVNRQLNRATDYGGRIGNVHIQSWRGRYRIDHIAIFKRSGAVHVPLFAADFLYLSVEWKELFHGAIVGKISMQRPRLNFVSGPTAAQTQTGKDAGWSDMLESLFPFKLNRLEIDDGQVHFQNEYSTPPVDIFLNHGSVTATNLSHSRKVKDELPAGVTARGKEKIGTWTAVGSLLRNAFIKALVPKVDEKMTLKKVEHKEQNEKELRSSPPPEKGAQELIKPDR